MAGAKGDIETMSERECKVRENLYRRMLGRRGFRLIKSKRKDPRALGYGGYVIADDQNRVVAGELNSNRALSLDQVAAWLEA